jgi:hypothetical protein
MSGSLSSSRLAGLLAYVRFQVNNAIAEQMNGQIQRIKANERGYRKFGSFRVAILFYLGGLDLYPQKRLIEPNKYQMWMGIRGRGAI